MFDELIMQMRIRGLSGTRLLLSPLLTPPLSLTFLHWFIQQILMVPGPGMTIRTKRHDSEQTMAGNKDRIWGSTLFLKPFLRMPSIPQLDGTERPLQRVSETFLGNNG